MIVDLDKSILNMSIKELMEYKDQVYREVDATERVVDDISLDIRKRRFENRVSPGSQEE
jgi:hypothetical protein